MARTQDKQEQDKQAQDKQAQDRQAQDRQYNANKGRIQGKIQGKNTIDNTTQTSAGLTIQRKQGHTRQEGHKNCVMARAQPSIMPCLGEMRIIGLPADRVKIIALTFASTFASILTSVFASVFTSVFTFALRLS